MIKDLRFWSIFYSADLHDRERNQHLLIQTVHN